MRGSLRKRYKDSWSIILDLGYLVDRTTGKLTRQQKWITVCGTKRDAEKRLSELLHDANRGQFVQPTKRTFGEWLEEWLEKAIKPPAKRLRTYETYKSVIERHLKPRLGGIPLQQLKAVDLKQYYTDQKLSQASLVQHHAIIHSSLRVAQLEGLVQRNVASLVIGKPRKPDDQDDVIHHCWEADEAKKFLEAARDAGPQQAAFYTLALHTGMRKAELCGLKWEDLDLENRRVSIRHQLVKPGSEPVFGPPKNGLRRTIDLDPETVALLRRHKAHQAEMKLANRQHYRDHGLMFAKELADLQRRQDTLGDPLQMNNLGQREYAGLIKKANVRPIKFHGLRHTCATLMLQANVPIKVVQERLGHKKIEITLGIYAHALPSMQQEAAAKLGAILHGGVS